MIDSAPTFRPEIHVTIGQLQCPNGYIVVPPAHPWASTDGAPETLNGREVTYYGLASEFFPGRYPSGSMALGIDTQGRMAGSDPLALMEEVSRDMIVSRGQAMALLPPEGVSWSNSYARERCVDRAGVKAAREIEHMAGDLVKALPRESTVTLLVRSGSGSFVAHVCIPNLAVETITCPCPGTFKATLRAMARMARTSPEVL